MTILLLMWYGFNSMQSSTNNTTLEDLSVLNEQEASMNDFLASYNAGEFERVLLVDEVNLQGYTETDETPQSFAFSSYVSPVEEGTIYYQLTTTQKPIQTTITDLGIDPESETTMFVTEFTTENKWMSFLLDTVLYIAIFL